jgi:hypothetical protein
MPALSTIYDYMRAHANLLGERILQEYPALHQFDDSVSPRIENLLRRPFPAQTVAIMGLVKRWQEARTGMVVAECGTGKTLISLGAIHIHSGGRPFTALAMVPPHLVEKWAREAFLTLPGVRVFLIDDLRNGGDENKSHGVNEARIRQGRIVRARDSAQRWAKCDYEMNRPVPRDAGCRSVGDLHYSSSVGRGRRSAISGGTPTGCRTQGRIWDVR